VPRLLVEHRALCAGAPQGAKTTDLAALQGAKNTRRTAADGSSPPNARQLALRSDGATKNLESMSLACNSELAHVT